MPASNKKSPSIDTPKKTNSQIGRMSKNKGAKGELEFAAICKDHGFAEARRTAQHCGKTGGAADVIGIPGIHVEVKRCEAGNLYNWLEQAKRDAAAARSGIPIVAHRKNNRDWVVIMDANDWFSLFSNTPSF
jgi:Holliday junction resolvase